MSVDAYMPLYVSDFVLATVHLESQAVGAYILALCAYWDGHCTGLVDEQNELQSICRCRDQDWSRVSGQIFGRLFKLEDGRWHQKRAREEYAAALERYGARVRAAEAANTASRTNAERTQTVTHSERGTNVERKQPEQEPDIKSTEGGVGTKMLSVPPTPTPTPTHTIPPQAASDPDAGMPTNKPTLPQALRYFAGNSDYADGEVRQCYRSFEVTKGADGSWFWGKQLVTDWRAAMEHRMAENRQRNPDAAPASTGARSISRMVKDAVRAA